MCLCSFLEETGQVPYPNKKLYFEGTDHLKKLIQKNRDLITDLIHNRAQLQLSEIMNMRKSATAMSSTMIGASNSTRWFVSGHQ
jgi:hypothetical protein